jgi:hypothetical protein
MMAKVTLPGTLKNEGGIGCPWFAIGRKTALVGIDSVELVRHAVPQRW